MIFLIRILKVSLLLLSLILLWSCSNERKDIKVTAVSFKGEVITYSHI